MLLYLVVDQIATSTHVSGCNYIFYVYTQTHFDCVNSQVNNLDDMKRFYRHKAISWKNLNL